jgi:hypothetical protein
MIGKALKLPVWIIKIVFKAFFGIIGFILAGSFTILRFVFSRLIGVITGLIAGIVLGSKHVGIKLFTGRKKKVSKKKT